MPSKNQALQFALVLCALDALWALQAFSAVPRNAGSNVALVSLIVWSTFHLPAAMVGGLLLQPTGLLQRGAEAPAALGAGAERRPGALADVLAGLGGRHLVAAAARVKPSPASAEARLMRRALGLARRAAALGEVPVGALLVQGPLDAPRPKVLAQAHNRTETRPDPTAHAERLVLERAARKLGRWRLNDCTLIVTLEPCAMCAGASVWARVGRIVYGAADPKAGACGSVLNVAAHPKLNHRIPVQGGVLGEECGALLKGFFQAKRQPKRKDL